jgi:pimeloyl-ACP methyl ester carboxylesterase
MLHSIGTWICGALALAILCYAPSARAEAVFGYEPELYFKQDYPREKDHKAMAIGPGGLSLIRSGMKSAAAAQKIVLRDCQRELARQGRTKAGKCELVAVDGKFVWAKPSVGPSLDVALPLPDGPLNKAKIFASQHSGPPKGIVLALHGSENNYGVSSAPYPFQKSWFDYFNSIGFQVIFPSAYDDVIPAYEYAGWNDPSTYARGTFMNKLRLAQTKRTISVLKTRYPGLPIYLWSHSAGGNIAQAIDSGIAGAIIVGTQCGIGSPFLNLVPKNVPVLYVYGENDPKIFRGSNKVTLARLKAFCGKAYGGKFRQIVIAPKAGHSTPLWRQSVLDAVAKFFNQSPFSLANPKSRFDMSDVAKKAYEKTYQTTPLKKAFAVGKSGYGFSASLSDQSEANIEALLKCNRAATGLSYPESGKHECALYAVGNKANY